MVYHCINNGDFYPAGLKYLFYLDWPTFASVFMRWHETRRDIIPTFADSISVDKCRG